MSNTLQQKAKDDSEALTKLRKLFEGISKSKASFSEKRRKNFANMQSLIDEDCPILQEIYQEAGTGLSAVEDKRDVTKDKIENKILPAIKYVDTQLKEFTEGIKDIKNDEDKLDSLRKDKTKAQQKKDTDKVNALKEEIEQMENDLKEKQKDHCEDIIKYERERIVNIKLVLLHYIHSELAMHLQSVDELSKLYKNLLEKKPISDLDAFTKKYCGEDSGIDLNQYGFKDEKKKSKSKGKIRGSGSRDGSNLGNSGSRQQIKANIEGENISKQIPSGQANYKASVGPFSAGININAGNNSKNKTNSKVADDGEFEV